MSLFDRLDEAKKPKMKRDTKFAEAPGTDAFQHSDRSKQGRRNHSPANFFRGRNKRYPLWQQRASAAGSLKQAYDRDPALGKKMAKEIKGNSALNMCPTILPECPPKRDHGKGGPPEHKTACKGKHCGEKPDHGGQYPWPFNHNGDKKWDKDWTALGAEHTKGSGKKRKKHEEFLPRRELLTLTDGL